MNGRGYTINELLLVTSLSAMLALAALPEMQRLLASWEMQGVQTELHAALLLARQAAMTRNRPVVVRNITGNWNNGWQVFVDADNDSRPDPGEPLLLQYDRLPDRVRLSSNFGQYARYRPNGRSSYASGAFMAGTWLICSPQISNHSRKLVMSYGGRVRRARLQAGCPG